MSQSLRTAGCSYLGCLGIADSLGAGGIARQLIGTVTITGMPFSTGIAVFLVPVLFVIVERVSHRTRQTPEGEPAAAPGPLAVPERASR